MPNKQRKKKKNMNKSSTVNGSKGKKATILPKMSSDASGSTTAVSFSMCTMDYARCLADPFGGPLGCIPNYPALFTRKTRVFSKGTFSTSQNVGAAGFGFIVMDPLHGIANDAAWVNASTNTYNFPVIDTVPVAGVTGFFSNSDYTAAQFGTIADLAEVRLVSAGLRYRYIGTELNRGGISVSLMEPNHQNLQGNNFGDIDGYLESVRLPIDRTWTTILYRPVDNSDLNFTGNPAPAVFTADNNYIAAVFADPGIAMPMEFEAYAVYEVTGRNVRAKTPSHVDGVGFDAVHAATQISSAILAPTKRPTSDTVAQFVNSALSYAGSAMSIVQKHPATPELAGQSANAHGSFLSGFDWAGAIKTGIGVASTLLGFL